MNKKKIKHVLLKLFLIAIIISVVMIHIIKPWKIPKNIYDAVINGDVKATKKFIEEGADVNKKYKDDYLLYSAISYLLFEKKEKYFETIKVLIDAGANVNIRSEYGYTPLFRVYSLTDDIKDKNQKLYKLVVKLEKLFIKAGATVNVSSENDLNFFFYTVRENIFELVECLLENKDTAGITQKDLNDALQIAKKKDYPVLAELLRQYGAKEK